MTVIKFSPGIIQAYPDIYKYVQNSLMLKFVSYVIDSNYRRSVWLPGWIKQQTENPDLSIVQLANRLRGNNHDETMLNILRYVQKNIKYVSDFQKWKVVERWQTAQETLTWRTGDCEDGATLIGVLAIVAGVPNERILWMCGTCVDGEEFGHCWLAYRATLYPLNWVFLDWCTDVTIREVSLRPQFYVNIKDITQFNPVLDGYQRVESVYKTLWFAFNVDRSFTEIRNVGATL
jgi:transglutaminase-like putative cysteine protease